MVKEEEQKCSFFFCIKMFSANLILYFNRYGKNNIVDMEKCFDFGRREKKIWQMYMGMYVSVPVTRTKKQYAEYMTSAKT